MIDKNEVEKIANLAKLKFNEEEKEKMAKELSNILTYMEVLNKINVDNVEENEIISSNVNVLRKDEEVKFENTEDILKNAKTISGQISVPEMKTQEE